MQIFCQIILRTKVVGDIFRWRQWWVLVAGIVLELILSIFNSHDCHARQEQLARNFHICFESLGMGAFQFRDRSPSMKRPCVGGFFDGLVCLFVCLFVFCNTIRLKAQVGNIKQRLRTYFSHLWNSV